MRGGAELFTQHPAAVILTQYKEGNLFPFQNDETLVLNSVNERTPLSASLVRDLEE